MHDYVKGIHLVLPGKTVLIQRESDPVVTWRYMEEIGANELISDDDLFNAAVVSFGTFGIIHAFIIETEPIFRLVSQVKRRTLAESLDALYSLDLGSVGFDVTDPSGIPGHVEAMINPYADTTDAVSLRIMQKIPLSDDDIAQIKDTAESFVPEYSGKDLSLSLGTEFLRASQSDAFPEGILDGHQDDIDEDEKRELYGALNDFAILSMMLYGGLREREGYPLELYGDPVSTLTDHFLSSRQHHYNGALFPTWRYANGTAFDLGTPCKTL